ncbi:MAG: alkaline phosphatase family protein [Acidobacteriota bacterium]|nr:alkaline phosphatase family protein [Acidobacteriota bacterium]
MIKIKQKLQKNRFSFKKGKSYLLLLLIIFISVLVISAGVFIYFKVLTSNVATNPVVLIGLDGADWHIIDPLIKQGKLPNLRKLIEEGSSGVLQTIKPTKSPVVWTSIATGKNMLKHGILDWAFVKKNNIEVPYSAGERRVKALWNILSEKNQTVCVINWFCTYPPDEVNGFLVSDRFRISVFKYLFNETVTFPPRLKKKIYPKVVRIKDRKYKKILRKEGIEDYLEKSRRLNIAIPEERLPQLRRSQIYILQDKSIENISLFLLEKFQVDFFATYLRLIDTTSHFGSLFVSKDLQIKWQEENEKYGMPTPETENLLYQGMVPFIEPIYTYMDNVVGRIIKRAREDTTFIIVSDHGFNFSKVGYNHYNTPEIPHGIIIMNGPQIKPGYHIEKAHVYDVTPTLLYLFDIPIGKDMDGKVILEAFNSKFKRRRKVQYIFSYESPQILPKKKRSKELDKEALEELRSLGYIK